MELGIGELRHAVDGEEHVGDAFGGPELGAVDVNVANLGFAECFALGAGLLAFGQPGDAVALQAAVQRASGELGDAVLKATHNVVEWQQGASAVGQQRISALISTTLR